MTADGDREAEWERKGKGGRGRYCINVSTSLCRFFESYSDRKLKDKEFCMSSLSLFLFSFFLSFICFVFPLNWKQISQVTSLNHWQLWKQSLIIQRKTSKKCPFLLLIKILCNIEQSSFLLILNFVCGPLDARHLFQHIWYSERQMRRKEANTTFLLLPWMGGKR